MTLSTTENALTAHVVVEDQLSFNRKLQVVNKIKHELEHHNIHHSTFELVRTGDQNVLCARMRLQKVKK
jgi:cobalt-zinc-cadmium efflux system protein